MVVFLAWARNFLHVVRSDPPPHASVTCVMLGCLFGWSCCLLLTLFLVHIGYLCRFSWGDGSKCGACMTSETGVPRDRLTHYVPPHIFM